MKTYLYASTIKNNDSPKRFAKSPPTFQFFISAIMQSGIFAVSLLRNFAYTTPLKQEKKNY